MNHPYEFIGGFISFQELHKKIESISRESLEKMILNPHVTFAYKPSEVKTELFGSKIKIVLPFLIYLGIKIAACDFFTQTAVAYPYYAGFSPAFFSFSCWAASFRFSFIFA